MNKWLQPVVFIWTVQPYLLVWLIAISFFVALTVVALLAKGKTWGQLILMLLSGWAVISLGSLLMTQLVFDLQVLSLEMIQTER